jgi:hypothetical protein
LKNKLAFIVKVRYTHFNDKAENAFFYLLVDFNDKAENAFFYLLVDFNDKAKRGADCNQD